MTAAIAIPFAGAHAADNCAEAVSIKSASKEAKTIPATASKHAAKTHDAATAIKLPVQTKVHLDSGKSQTVTLPSDKKNTGLKAFQKYKGHCC